MSEAPDDGTRIRGLIQHFIKERLDTKLAALKDDDPKRDKLIQQFDYETWIEDAARRASQLQVVTHSLKPIHPDAKGTSLYAPPAVIGARTPVGTHTLGDSFDVDVVGNAAALDVFKFLKLEHDGVTLLERVKNDDPDLKAALSDDSESAIRWLQAFSAITQPSGHYASHARGKQLYWLANDDPTADEDFHLLAPLYATSLAHRVFRTINDDRFSDMAKAAREARRKGTYSESGYVDYPGLAVQRFGGSKPQNISQLNSERGGNSYLLGSLPPSWRSSKVRPPLKTQSAFRVFGFRREVRHIVRDLRRLLGSDLAPVMETRDLRDELTSALIDELLIFTTEIHCLTPGWSNDGDCQLDAAQQFWLDPYRAETDDAFRASRQQSAWPTDIRGDFARWLNKRVGRRLVMGDAEHRQWAQTVRLDMDFEDFIHRDRAWMETINTELSQLEEALPDV